MLWIFMNINLDVQAKLQCKEKQKPIANFKNVSFWNAQKTQTQKNNHKSQGYQFATTKKENKNKSFKCHESKCGKINTNPKEEKQNTTI